VHDDEFNKAISLGCADGHLCLSMTGLALINGRRTMEWLAHQIVEGQRDFSMGALLRKIEERLTDAYSRMQYPAQRLTIVGVGSFESSGGRRPLIVRISNFEPSEEFGKGVGREFKLTWSGLPSGRKVALLASGCTSAIGEQENEVLHLAARRFNEGQKVEELMLALRRAIHMASCHGKDGWAIGKSCMAQFVPHGDNAFEFQHYLANGEKVQEAPITVSPPGIVSTGMRFWSGEVEDAPTDAFPFLERASRD